MKGTIDEVVVKVTGQVDSNSVDNINKLATSLNNLKTSIKGGFNNLSTLASALQELKTNATGLAQLNKSLGAVKGITDALKPLETITSPKGLTKTIRDLEQLPAVFANITPNTLQNVARVANELAVALTPLANKFADIAVGFSSLQALADKYGISVTKITEGTTKTINKMTVLKRVVEAVKSPFVKLSNSFGSFGKGVHKNIDKLTSKIKQLGLSLLGTRSIFTATRKAISEYMQMDEQLSKQTTNLWRALGAQLAPAVEFVLYLFKQFTRAVYSFVYAITGVDLIARANAKAMAGWGKSAKDTLGNLQKFDDLNVADFGKGSGDNALIELDKIDLSPIQWIIDATIKIKNAFKEAFDTGQWKGVGEALANMINDVFKHINIDILRKKVFKFFDNLGDVVQGYIERLDLSIIALKLGEIISSLLKGFNRFVKKIPWKKVGSEIGKGLSSINLPQIISDAMDLTKSIILGFIDAFTNVPWDTVGTELSNSVKTFLKKTDQLIREIPWKKIGNEIRTFIINFDWSGLFEEIVNIAKNIIGGTGNLLDGLFNTTIFSTLASSLSDIINSVKTIGSTIISTLGEGTAAGSVLNLVKSIVESIKIFTSKINKTISEWTVSPEFQSVVSNIDGIITNVANMLSGIIDDFNTWYDSEGADDTKEILKTITGIFDTLSDIVKKLTDELGPAFNKVFKVIGIPLVKTLLSQLEKVLNNLKFIIDFLDLTFAPDWKKLFRGIITGNSKDFTEAYNSIARKLNKLADDINNMFNLNIIKSRISYIGISDVIGGTGSGSFGGGGGGSRGYADGGFPESGQYFYARENGIPEYVGSIGSRTAVANNNQIIEGIKQGVMEAMSETTTVQPVVVNVGNKTLYEEQRRYNNFQRNKYGSIKV